MGWSKDRPIAFSMTLNDLAAIAWRHTAFDRALIVNAGYYPQPRLDHALTAAFLAYVDNGRSYVGAEKLAATYLRRMLRTQDWTFYTDHKDGCAVRREGAIVTEFQWQLWESPVQTRDPSGAKKHSVSDEPDPRFAYRQEYLPDTQPAELALYRTEVQGLIRYLAENMKPLDYALLIMVDYYEYSQPMMQEVLGEAPSTVCTRLHRARKKAAKLLKESGIDWTLYKQL